MNPLETRRSIEVMEAGTAQPRTLSLFAEDRCEGLLPDASIVRLNLSQVRLRRPRQWGACWLALELWRGLGLDRFWAERLGASRKGTRWDQVLFVLVAYRLLAPGSEWRLHREWFDRSALADLLGEDAGLAESHKLYRCHDRLLAHKQAVFEHLIGRWRDLFNVSFDVLLYDLTSTYFESDPPFPEDDKRRCGYSRDHRSDCVQVIIALVVTPEGLPLAYEVLPGNTADNTTLRGFLDHIERQYGKARRIWLMDRGVPSEAVLAEMRAADPPVQYLVGTPKGRLTRLEKALVAKPWQDVRPGVQVKLLPQDGELYVFAQSTDRVAKERAIRRRQLKWLWGRLKQLAGMKLTREELLMRLGAARKEARTAWRLIAIDVAADSATLSYRLDRAKLRQARRREGGYLLRTNLTDEIRRGCGACTSRSSASRRRPIPQGRPRHSADLPPGRGAHRGAYLHRLPRLLPPRHARLPPPRPGARPDAAQRHRKVRGRADDRSACPDDRRPRANADPLYRAGTRARPPARQAQIRPARPAETQNHRRAKHPPVVPTLAGRTTKKQALRTLRPRQSAKLG
jgi:Transposase DDE domain